jgi:probable H4MPT-linked C1 transfer pathway protein
LTATATTVGWDLGGAHLKRVVLDSRGRITDARQLACPLWRGLEHLTAALESVHEPGDARHAVTMTGELCDNFGSREAGVVAIAETAVRVLGSSATRFYAGPAGWLAPDALNRDNASDCASANWYATAQAVAQQRTDALLIDVGSTTTDLVPIADGRVACRGFNDASRMSCTELVYTGVVRTPLMALADSAPYDGATQGLAAEYFANTADIYRLRGELPECADLHETADGEDRSVESSGRRVMRMLGRDLAGDPQRVRRVADYFAYRQFDLLQRALLRVTSGMSGNCSTIVAAGVGHFLVEQLAAFNAIECVNFASLFELAGADPDLVSTCAPAVAVAVLRAATA